MPNKDHRTPNNDYWMPFTTTAWGYRVRGMNISRNYPGTKLILKRSQILDAKKEIKLVRRAVKKFNALPSVSRPHCVLLPPIAYSVGKGLIAMREVKYPAVDELIDFRTSEYGTLTPRGAQWVKRLQRKGMDMETFRDIVDEVSRITDIAPRNIMVLGVQKGKLILMPFVDSY
ncbi:MAG: hypothetical protein IPJ89_02010 [Candidatus Iainarchaeum archaeon]|uniref:Uncharacterized protein n=1 Tax=Candidatus Iainarchaeum sp. TaxID=3101447 RepID=A0A7T9DKJ5_9ARCH|nr:MAG: hypothetical protein IPJ89_02010 [Candidatus Diapherotrites archaeon]